MRTHTAFRYFTGCFSLCNSTIINTPLLQYGFIFLSNFHAVGCVMASSFAIYIDETLELSKYSKIVEKIVQKGSFVFSKIVPTVIENFLEQPAHAYPLLVSYMRWQLQNGHMIPLGHRSFCIKQIKGLSSNPHKSNVTYMSLMVIAINNKIKSLTYEKRKSIHGL
jgi:hypothetical protein